MILRNLLGRGPWGRTLSPFSKQVIGRRNISQGAKVAVLGCAGETGQPLSLLLKQSAWVGEVALYDPQGTMGLALELNQIDTPALATSHEGSMGLQSALKDAQIVVILAASEEDDLAGNGKIVTGLAKACIKYCPEAMVVLGTRPVNSLLPAVVEGSRRGGSRGVDCSRAFGLASLESIRAASLLADALGIAPEGLVVPVVGGASPTTAVPLLSAALPPTNLTMEETVKIVRGLQGAEAEVQKAKGEGRASLSAAFAAAKFVEALAKAAAGHQRLVETAFVVSQLVPNVPYFASQVELGPTGVSKFVPMPDLTDYECCLLETAIGHLKKDIQAGERLAAKIQ